ncbi:hypothetical protein CTM93_07100 [Photobacterium phosphoreum]|nr:hypothetical protein CTM93_07100 [Photobacterium phosphoreum]
MKEVLILFIAYRKVKCINRIIFTIFLIIIIIINKMFDNIENKSINMFLKYMVAKKRLYFNLDEIFISTRYKVFICNLNKYAVEIKLYIYYRYNMLGLLHVS